MAAHSSSSTFFARRHSIPVFPPAIERIESSVTRWKSVAWRTTRGPQTLVLRNELLAPPGLISANRPADYDQARETDGPNVHWPPPNGTRAWSQFQSAPKSLRRRGGGRWGVGSRSSQRTSRRNYKPVNRRHVLAPATAGEISDGRLTAPAPSHRKRQDLNSGDNITSRINC